MKKEHITQAEIDRAIAIMKKHGCHDIFLSLKLVVFIDNERPQPDLIMINYN